MVGVIPLLVGFLDLVLVDGRLHRIVGNEPISQPVHGVDSYRLDFAQLDAAPVGLLLILLICEISDSNTYSPP